MRKIFATPISSRKRTLGLAVFLLCVAAWMGPNFLHDLQGSDFPDFYCAARIFMDGHGHQLYNEDLQRACQARYAGGVSTIYIHPPFEAVAYLPVAWLPIRTAYLAWFAVNLALLALTMFLLQSSGFLSWDWTMTTAAALVFVPIFLCLRQGQDSLLLMVVIVLAFAALRAQNNLAAGCWLGLGLFKFQIVIPIAVALLFCLPKEPKTRFGTGFVLIGLLLAALSVALCGFSVFEAYPALLKVTEAEPHWGSHPAGMANLRGLFQSLFGRHSTLALPLILVFSFALLVLVVVRWQKRLMNSATTSGWRLFLADSILFALLVSYYLNPHDLSLAILPMFLLSNTLHLISFRQWHWRECVRAVVLAILFLPPLSAWSLAHRSYFALGVPLLFLFLLNGWRELPPVAQIEKH